MDPLLDFLRADWPWKTTLLVIAIVSLSLDSLVRVFFKIAGLFHRVLRVRVSPPALTHHAWMDGDFKPIWVDPPVLHLPVVMTNATGTDLLVEGFIVRVAGEEIPSEVFRLPSLGAPCTKGDEFPLSAGRVVSLVLQIYSPPERLLEKGAELWIKNTWSVTGMVKRSIRKTHR